MSSLKMQSLCQNEPGWYWGWDQGLLVTTPVPPSTLTSTAPSWDFAFGYRLYHPSEGDFETQMSVFGAEPGFHPHRTRHAKAAFAFLFSGWNTDEVVLT